MLRSFKVALEELVAPGHWRGRLWLPQRRPAISVNVFSATTGDRSRATHARSHPSNLARRHILAAKPRAAAKPRGLRNNGAPMELRRQEPAPRRLAVLYKLFLPTRP
jgi:hypothetical protein